MDQIKIGQFLKQLRTQKGLTQERLAESLGVSNRTVSRWENGVNLPDFDLLIELSKLYDVGLEEIIHGQRKVPEAEREQTIRQVAEYAEEKKRRLLKSLHILAWLGAAADLVYLLLDSAGLAESGFGEFAASYASGLALGALIVFVIFTSPWFSHIHQTRKRLFQKLGGKNGAA